MDGTWFHYVLLPINHKFCNLNNGNDAKSRDQELSFRFLEAGYGFREIFCYASDLRTKKCQFLSLQQLKWFIVSHFDVRLLIQYKDPLTVVQTVNSVCFIAIIRSENFPTYTLKRFDDPIWTVKRPITVLFTVCQTI